LILVDRPIATQPRVAIALLTLLVLMWGCNWPINKTILTYVSPLWCACLRLGLGAFSLLLAQTFLRVHIKPPSRIDIPIVLSVGVVQMVAVVALMTFGLSIVPAGRSSILIYNATLGGSGSNPFLVAPEKSVARHSGSADRGPSGNRPKPICLPRLGPPG
jgi:hypothetical protein